MIPHTWSNEVPFEHYLQYSSILLSHGGHFEKWLPFFSSRISSGLSTQKLCRGGPLNTLIPNTCLQQPVSGRPQKRGFAPQVRIKNYTQPNLMIQVSFSYAEKMTVHKNYSWFWSNLHLPKLALFTDGCTLLPELHNAIRRHESLICL